MDILTKEVATLYYDELIEIVEEPTEAHEKISYLYQTLNSLTQEITADSEIAFSSLSARLQYLVSIYLLPAAYKNELLGIISLYNQTSEALNKTTLNALNKPEQAKNIPQDLAQVATPNNLAAAIKAIANAIQFFSSANIPADVAELYQAYKESSLSQNEGDVAYTNIAFVRAVILKVGKVHTHENGQQFTPLFCSSIKHGLFNIALWDAKPKKGAKRPSFGYALSRWAAQLWPYATLNFFNVEHIQNTPQHKAFNQEDNENKVHQFRFSNKSQVVLDPDYLIDATQVANCFTPNGINPLLALLDKLLNSPTTEAMLAGKMVNDVLDEMLHDPKQDVDIALRNCYRSSALTAVKIGEQAVKEILHTVRTVHLPNLKDVAQYYHTLPIRTEPTFFSAKYGLQGRLDVLVESASNPYEKNVFELKSGKPPFYGVWQGNEMQVVVYNLLLKSTFSDERTGKSSIFYSRAAEKSIRNVVSNQFLERTVLMVRNWIVLIRQKICLGHTDFLERVAKNRFGGYPSYKEKDIEAFESAYRHATETEKIYFNTYFSFVMRELRTAKLGSETGYGNTNGGFADLWRNNFAVKKAAYSLIHGLKLTSHTDGRLVFKRCNNDVSNFRLHDIGILYPQNSQNLQPLNYQILKGTIAEMDNEQLVVQLRNKTIGADYFEQFAYWVFERDFMESNYTQLTRNLFAFLQAPAHKRQLLLGKSAPSQQPLPNVSLLNQLPQPPTPNQQQVIAEALAAQDYYLLQGPPGTGKTTTLVNIIDLTQQQQEPQNIVVLAFTNRAANEIGHKLTQRNLKHIRIGRNGTTDSNVLFNMVHELKYIDLANALKACQLFLGTVSSFLSRKDELTHIANGFHTLIVDEASQLLEPHLIGILPQFKRFILVGDQNQLPAVITQKEALCFTQQEALLKIGISDLRVSLFERLLNNSKRNMQASVTGMLTDHFRMHKDIADSINHYYNNQLTAYTPVQKEPLPPPASQHPISKILARARLLHLPTQYEASSKHHIQEAQLCLQLALHIQQQYGQNFNHHTLGIITPWRAQISQINRLIEAQAPELLNKVHIDTVERFQGSEKDIIIISLAIYNPQQIKAMQSLNTDGSVDRKLNVALSRAKKQVIILGHTPALEQNKHYQHLLQTIHQKGGSCTPTDVKNILSSTPVLAQL